MNKKGFVHFALFGISLAFILQLIFSFFVIDPIVDEVIDEVADLLGDDNYCPPEFQDESYKVCFNAEGKVFIDGLARKISMLCLDYPDFIKNIKLLRSAIKKAQFVSKPKTRENVKKSNGVIIAPSGMLKGGTVIDYIQTILQDPLSAIYLVGYQVEGTPGRSLLDKGIFEFKESRKNKPKYDLKIEAQCDYDYFDFSSHSDNIHIHNYIENLNFKRDSNADIFCIHGDSKSTTSLASDLVNKNYNSVAPEIGEIYHI